MFSLGEMARILGDGSGRQVPNALRDAVPAQAVTDSRQAGPGSLFVCIKGERADGHDFIRQVAGQGALAVLAERDVFAGEVPPLAVLCAENSVTALGRLGAAQRDAFKGFVVGVTGSAGKTSVKEVLASVLGVRGKTSKNFLNYNSQIGLPVSLLNADAEAAFWVMEAGISAPHDMDELGAILRPDLAVILNVGAAHLSGLEDKGVAYYKSRLLAHLAPGGLALASADYPELVHECRNCGAGGGLNVKYFSTRNTDADYYAAYLGAASPATGRYRLHIKGGESFEVAAPFRGGYGSENVAAIGGAAHLAGLSASEIILGFAGAALPKQRFSCQTRGAFTLIDDSYNSNPLSAARMLESAAEIARDGAAPLILVMGEMLELGAEAERAHRDLGRQMAASGARMIIWKGRSAEAGAAVRAGLQDGAYGGSFREVGSPEEFIGAMRLFGGFIRPGKSEKAKGVVLFKASRGLRLELWAEAFKNDYFLKLEE